VLAAGGFVSAASMRIAEPMLPDIASQFGEDVVDAAIVITAFAVAYGVFQLVHGPLGDRFGKLRVVCIAVFLAAAASLACATASSIDQLMVYRFFAGMTIGAVIPLSLAFVGDNVDFENRQPVLGRFISGLLLGGAAGSIVAGFSSDYLGWRASFVIVAVGFFLVGLLLVSHARAETGNEAARGKTFSNLKTLLRRPLVHVICGIVALEGWLFYGAFGYLGAFLRHEYLLEFAVVGLMLAGFSFGGLLYSASVRLLVTRLGITRMVVSAGFLLLLCFIGLSTINSWYVAAVLILMLGFSFNMMHNTLQTQASEMAPEARGSAIAVFAFSLFIGQALGVMADGKIVEFAGYRPMLLFTGFGLVVLSGYFAWFLHRRDPG